MQLDAPAPTLASERMGRAFLEIGEGDNRLGRGAILLVLAIAIAHAVTAWLGRTPGFGWGEDDAAYLLLGQSLRHFSYRELQDVGAPIHARFPPVFPLLLAMVGAPVGDNLGVLLAFVALCSGAALQIGRASCRERV